MSDQSGYLTFICRFSHVRSNVPPELRTKRPELENRPLGFEMDRRPQNQNM